jgi:hypothetical protein
MQTNVSNSTLPSSSFTTAAVNVTGFTGSCIGTNNLGQRTNQTQTLFIRNCTSRWRATVKPSWTATTYQSTNFRDTAVQSSGTAVISHT